MLPKNEQRQNPDVERFAAAIAPSSINSENKTVDVCFYTGATVARNNWRDGEFKLTLSVEPDAISFDRLNSGAPVLRNHDQYATNLEDVQTGVVERGWLVLTCVDTFLY